MADQLTVKLSHEYGRAGRAEEFLKFHQTLPHFVRDQAAKAFCNGERERLIIRELATIASLVEEASGRETNDQTIADLCELMATEPEVCDRVIFLVDLLARREPC